MKYNKVPYESESWGHMSEMKFSDIVIFSNIFPKWREWKYVKENKTYKKSLLKPVNMYVSNFSKKPEIEKINKKTLSIKYYNYSDILIQIADPLFGNRGVFKSKPINSLFYAIDKCWLRQFYPSNNEYEISDSSMISDRIFKMYIPWFLDMDIEYKIKTNLDNSSIKVIEKNDFFTKTDDNVIIKEANFVDFYFTNSSRHMINELCGIIEKGSYMYEIQIESSKKNIKKIIRAYEKI